MSSTALKLTPTRVVTSSGDEITLEQSTLRTIRPTAGQVPGFSRGINLLKIVNEYASVELEEIDLEISDLVKKLEAARYKREFVQRLHDVAFEYKP